MSTALSPLPQPITDAADALEREWASHGWVPTNAELHRPGKPSLWKLHDLLTIADLGQVAEGHTRRARMSIRRFVFRGRSRRTLRTAARHIMLARMYTILRLARLGMAIEERLLPFPSATEDDIARWEREEANE